MKRGRLWLELVGGLVLVTLLSGIGTFIGILVWSRRDFDRMVEEADVETAKTMAAALADHHARFGSWEGVEETLKTPTWIPYKFIPPKDERSEDHHRPGERALPIVLTDTRGNPVFIGLDQTDGRLPRNEGGIKKLDTTQGVPIESGGSIIGYVFFKSMIFRQYDSHEAAFIDSLRSSIGISVLIGILLSLGLGSFLAVRFTRPIAVLETAVRKIDAGDLSARVSIDRDDEIGNLARNFNSMADRLETNETARQNLIADVAHELRTPISIIQSNLEMMIEGIYASDGQRLQSLYDETLVLTRLIGDLRSMSDLELGIVPIEVQAMDLGALVYESWEKYRPLYEERHIDLSLEKGDGNAEVWGDKERLRQVLRNILENALKHSEERSTVKISVQRPTQAVGGQDIVQVSVSDEGPGVPVEELGKIFERFYRVDRSRNRESGGRGLGLAICKQFVEACGGSIAARNRTPKGLEISIYLKRASLKAV